jgi:hypothetical protein
MRLQIVQVAGFANAGLRCTDVPIISREVK